MSETTPTAEVSDVVRECSHDPAYRVARKDGYGRYKHCSCGRCGSYLWIVDGTVLVTVRKASVADFVYKCADCGDVFEYPGAASGHGCE